MQEKKATETDKQILNLGMEDLAISFTSLSCQSKYTQGRSHANGLESCLVMPEIGNGSYHGQPFIWSAVSLLASTGDIYSCSILIVASSLLLPATFTWNASIPMQF